MSFVTSLVAGNGIRRVVQLGHHYGYSALLLGFTLRAMGARPGLVTIDITPAACAFTQRWLAHAGLGDHVVVREGDSADPRMADDAAAVLGGPPELVLVDSSHAYSHTLAELDLWTPRLRGRGLRLLHDASEFATAFDPTAEGGVRRAIAEWLPGHPAMTGLTLNGHVAPGADGDALVYKESHSTPSGRSLNQGGAPSPPNTARRPAGSSRRGAQGPARRRPPFWPPQGATDGPSFLRYRDSPTPSS